jgi:hypothetical protein
VENSERIVKSEWRLFSAEIDLTAIPIPAIRLWRGIILCAEKQPNFRFP